MSLDAVLYGLIVVGLPLTGLFLLIVTRAPLTRWAGATLLATFVCFVWWTSYGFDPPPDPEPFARQLAIVLFFVSLAAAIALLAGAAARWWARRTPFSR